MLLRDRLRQQYFKDWILAILEDTRREMGWGRNGSRWKRHRSL